MLLALLDHIQHLSLGFFAPLYHGRVRKREDLLALVHIDEVRHLKLANHVYDGILLVLGHDQLEQIHVFASKD